MMGRCFCFLLEDGKMFLLLLDGKMCLVQVEDGKMFLLLLDRMMCLVLLEVGSSCRRLGISAWRVWKMGKCSWSSWMMGRCSCFLLDDGKMFLFPAG
jgi:hypothetical protein